MSRHAFLENKCYRTLWESCLDGPWYKDSVRNCGGGFRKIERKKGRIPGRESFLQLDLYLPLSMHARNLVQMISAAGKNL